MNLFYCFNLVQPKPTLSSWSNYLRKKRFRATFLWEEKVPSPMFVRHTLNLHSYEFIPQKACAPEDPEFETFYTKNIFLNKGSVFFFMLGHP